MCKQRYSYTVITHSFVKLQSSVGDLEVAGGEGETSYVLLTDEFRVHTTTKMNCSLCMQIRDNCMQQ